MISYWSLKSGMVEVFTPWKWAKCDKSVWFFLPFVFCSFAVCCMSTWWMCTGTFVYLSKIKQASCPTLCDPMDYTVRGILQARILEWVVIPFSRRSSQPRDRTQVSHIAGGFFTSWATREAQTNSPVSGSWQMWIWEDPMNCGEPQCECPVL